MSKYWNEKKNGAKYYETVHYIKLALYQLHIAVQKMINEKYMLMLV